MVEAIDCVVRMVSTVFVVVGVGVGVEGSVLRVGSEVSPVNSSPW